MPRETSLENRYHLQIFDASGAQLSINNLTRDEVDEFNAGHESDDLDYSVRYGAIRPNRAFAK